MRPCGSPERVVRRQKFRIQSFRERDVGRVIGREIRAELYDAGDERGMPVPREGQIEVVEDGLGCPVFAQPVGKQRTSHDRCNLDVAQRRRMQLYVLGLNDRGDRTSS